MANERPNLKQIRIKQSVCARLDERKSKDDSYTDVIKALLDENTRLNEYVEELKQDKHMLMKIAMRTPDSIALPNLAHKVFFAVTETMKLKDVDVEDKILYVRIYLKDELKTNPREVLNEIEEFKQEYDPSNEFLNDLSKYIRDHYVVN